MRNRHGSEIGLKHGSNRQMENMKKRLRFIEARGRKPQIYTTKVPQEKYRMVEI